MKNERKVIMAFEGIGSFIGGSGKDRPQPTEDKKAKTPAKKK